MENQLPTWCPMTPECFRCISYITQSSPSGIILVCNTPSKCHWFSQQCPLWVDGPVQNHRFPVAVLCLSAPSNWNGPSDVLCFLCPWHFWRSQGSCFRECFSIWVCLLFCHGEIQIIRLRQGRPWNAAVVSVHPLRRRAIPSAPFLMVFTRSTWWKHDPPSFSPE